MTTNVLADFETAVAAFYHKVVTNVEQFATEFAPKAENLLEVAFTDLAELAGEAVLTQATALISGKEKFGNAVTHVVQTVEASGKTVAIQSAQAAVQVAYLTAQNVAAGK